MKTQTLIKTLPLSLLAVAACATQPQSSSRAVATSPALYTFESDANGFNTKSFFYDNGEEVVAIDTQFTPDLAKKSIEFLRTKTQNPISYVIISHPNPDKFNGISEFKKLGAKVIASKLTAQAMAGVHAYKKYYFVNMAKMFTEESYPQLAQVDETFDSQMTLRLNSGETLELLETGIAGVSSNQTLVHIPSQNTVLVGDLVHHKAHAWLEGGIVNGQPTPSVATWIKNLELIAKEFSSQTLVVGGRGQDGSVASVIPAQIAYLKRADKIVSDYVKSLGNKASELQSEKAAEHHAALTKIFEAEFPSYALSYMIGYGVYGLANSKL